MRVLIVDDYPDIVETTCALLTSEGHDCQGAISGFEALATAESFNPELAILDIRLPDIDGYAVLGALRARFANRAPYLVALTGWAHAVKKALEAGFDECFLKPAGREQILRAVRLAQQRTQYRDEEATHHHDLPVLEGGALREFPR